MNEYVELLAKIKESIGLLNAVDVFYELIKTAALVVVTCALIALIIYNLLENLNNDDKPLDVVRNVSLVTFVVGVLTC